MLNKLKNLFGYKSEKISSLKNIDFDVEDVHDLHLKNDDVLSSAEDRIKDKVDKLQQLSGTADTTIKSVSKKEKRVAYLKINFLDESSFLYYNDITNKGNNWFEWKDFYKWFTCKDTPFYIFISKYNENGVRGSKSDIMLRNQIKSVTAYTEIKQE